MTDVLTHTFVNLMSQKDSKKELGVTSPASTQCGVLLVGEHNMGRSVLLLAAITAASQMGIRVVFFTQTQIQNLPLCLQKCVPGLSPESLKKIKFCYPRTLEELLQQVAGLHESTNTFPIPPALIIIDRLQNFLCGPAGILEQVTSSPTSCRIIASYQPKPQSRESSVPDQVLNTLDRYFQVRCTLDQDRSNKAAANGLKEVWHIYFSGTGISVEPCTKETQLMASSAQEWELFVYPDGLMEFRLV
ncbi:ATPase SWSAP1 isoform X2 [Corythoichthys intestinalis]|uniref:ATPase SWSAP1 isoform X2 n=1 Tax=Corythoichthys intestinalis TaxID=161448 RepID=UPI0025A585BC|nr:ATPase SWSAP1 isoform X2 [Corythoichthys intestinalis]